MPSLTTSEPSWIGLDIGGANIKLAAIAASAPDLESRRHIVHSHPFALWRHSAQLSDTLVQLLSPFDSIAGVAVTLTGELADSFPNRAAGVAFIVDAVNESCEVLSRKHNQPGHPSLAPVFYALPSLQKPASQIDDRRGWEINFSPPDFLTAAEAKQQWQRVAAANWHAIAWLASCFLDDPPNDCPGSGYLIDVGSTTTDIIPILSFETVSIGRTDRSRLESGELVYAGVQRTPICSLVEAFDLDGKTVPVAREFFATIDDAFLVAEQVEGDPQRLDTADGRPATQFFAQQRLAKMIGCDAISQLNDAGSARPTSGDAIPGPANDYLTEPQLKHLAQQTIGALKTRIRFGLHTVCKSSSIIPRRFVVSGQGDWFAQQVIEEHFDGEAEVIRLADKIDSSASRGAAAYAIAKLAAQHLSPSYLQPGIIDSGNQPAKECEHAYEESDQAYAHPMDQTQFRVIKLGGSLLNWPETPARIQSWIRCQPPMANLWIVGGGQLVDAVRQFDGMFSLDDETAHWICIDLMSINLRLVQGWFPDWPLVSTFDRHGFSQPSSSGLNCLFDFGAYISRNKPDDLSETSLPANWSTSSDSCSAWLANNLQADELVLLKSCQMDTDQDLVRMTAEGVVDPCFAGLARTIPQVRIENLREMPL